MKLTLITGNEGKRREFSSLLDLDIEATKIELVEPQHWDVRVVAEAKSVQAYAIVGSPVIVDDSALEIEAWNSLPGALTSWFLDRVGNAGLLKMASSYADRSATVLTALGYCDADGPRCFLGEIHGTLSTEELGTNGFGFDPIFIPKGETRTYAELSDIEKNAVSMRRMATEKLKSFLGSRTDR